MTSLRKMGLFTQVTSIALLGGEEASPGMTQTLRKAGRPCAPGRREGYLQRGETLHLDRQGDFQGKTSTCRHYSVP